jgi:hypothetical protein
MELTTQQKTELILRFFSGRKDALIYQDPKTGGVKTAYEGIATWIPNHLNGSMRIGVFPCVNDETKWSILDFDSEDRGVIDKIYACLLDHNLFPYLERSKSKGFHIWIFFDEPVRASDIRLVLLHLVNKAGIDPKTIEIFPKQDNADKTGNGVFLPLQGQSIKQGRNVFVNNAYVPYPDQWDFLSKVHFTKAETITSIIEDADLKSNNPLSTNKPYTTEDHVPFEEGFRNEDTHHLSRVLAKEGKDEETIKRIIEPVAIASGINKEETEKAIKSAVKKVEQEKQIRKDDLFLAFQTWFEGVDGTFTMRQVYEELSVRELKDKDRIRKWIKELVTEQDKAERCGTITGTYRKIILDEEKFLIPMTDPIPLKVVLPCGAHEFVKLFNGNIIVIAGTSNAGKSAYCLNTGFLNRYLFKVRYLSCEMDSDELRERMGKFRNFDYEEWTNKIDYVPIKDNCHDLVKPGCFNIVDYLDVPEGEYFKIAHFINLIHRKLHGEGLALISLQKNHGALYGDGGIKTIHKSKLAISIDPNRIQIVKGKTWVDGGSNPEGMIRKFKLWGGINFEWESWEKGTLIIPSYLSQGATDAQASRAI